MELLSREKYRYSFREYKEKISFIILFFLILSSCSIDEAEENKLCLRKFKVYSFISKSKINTNYKVITFGKDGDSVRFVLNNDINIGEVKITKDSSAISINGIRKNSFSDTINRNYRSKEVYPFISNKTQKINKLSLLFNNKRHEIFIFKEEFQEFIVYSFYHINLGFIGYYNEFNDEYIYCIQDNCYVNMDFLTLQRYLIDKNLLGIRLSSEELYKKYPKEKRRLLNHN